MDELTKQVVASHKTSNQQKIDQNLKDIAQYQATIAKLEEENVKLSNENTVLTTDIPEPTAIIGTI